MYYFKRKTCIWFRLCVSISSGKYWVDFSQLVASWKQMNFLLSPNLSSVGRTGNKCFAAGPRWPSSKFPKRVNEKLEVDKDYVNYKLNYEDDQKNFTFIQYPFMLSVQTKTMSMFYDNRVNQIREKARFYVKFLHRQSLLTSSPKKYPAIYENVSL